MVHATMEKFGYPRSLISEYGHWAVLLRPAQATLGALAIVSRSEARAFSDLRPDAYLELGRVVGDVEAVLRRFRPYDRINYLMLMMVDPHVHFHVLPRYATSQDFEGVAFADPGWPGAPDLRHSADVRPELFDSLRDQLKSGWPTAA